MTLAVLSSGAFAASRATRLESAHAKLREGDAAAAVALLRELQVEDPADERVLYALACAQYRLAEGGAAGGDPAAAFREAKSSFDALTRAKDPVIKRQASFDRANCLTQAAKLVAASAKNPKEAILPLRDASAAYDSHLIAYPDDKGAQQNRDHVRFLLKKLQREQQEQQDEQKQEQEDQPPQDQPTGVLSVSNAATELPGATAVVGEDATVQLVKPGASQ